MWKHFGFQYKSNLFMFVFRHLLSHIILKVSVYSTLTMCCIARHVQLTHGIFPPQVLGMNGRGSLLYPRLW